MMTPEQLKNSILQLAIEGKLVPQIESEGTGAELLEKIKKSPLIEGKKLAKSKHNASQLGEVANEVSRRGFPFAIPKTWAWCRLGDVCDKIVDGDHNPPPGITEKSEFFMISAVNVNNDKLVNLDNVRYLGKETFKLENQRTDIVKGDILFTIVGTMGRSCVYSDNYNISCQRSVCVIKTEIFNFFLKRVLDSPYIQNYMNYNSTGTAQKGFYLRQVSNLLIPLPPLAEQKRIVAKLEELLPLVDEYAEAYNKLQILNTKFPGDLKKSLLQYAMEGKLVPCDTSKWKQVKLGEVCDVVMGQSPEGNSVGEHCEGIEFHQGKIYFGENSLLPSPLKTSKPTKIAESGSLLLCVRAPVGVVNITERKICIGRGLCSINPKWDAPNEFMLYWMRCLTKYFEQQATGTTFKAISNTIIKNTVIPLPPLAEQKRIVAKLEELLPLCEELKGGK